MMIFKRRHSRLYVSRKVEGREHASIENSLDGSMKGLEDYIKKSQERLITVCPVTSMTAKEQIEKQ